MGVMGDTMVPFREIPNAVALLLTKLVSWLQENQPSFMISVS